VPTTKELKEWKRSRYTTNLIGRIRNAIRNAGYEEECGIVPVCGAFSVVVRKGDQVFNLRLNRDNLSIISTESIEYKMKKERISRVFRKECT
jgi:hypothetical protein